MKANPTPYNPFPPPLETLDMLACIPTERLLAVAIADHLLLTPDEFDHLGACRDCIERWEECMVAAGRRFERG
jgi:hypothetical protein